MSMSALLTNALNSSFLLQIDLQFIIATRSRSWLFLGLLFIRTFGEDVAWGMPGLLDVELLIDGVSNSVALKLDELCSSMLNLLWLSEVIGEEKMSGL